MRKISSDLEMVKVTLFGGDYNKPGFGSGWYPGVFRRTKQYLEQRSWRNAGYTWWDFVKFGPKSGMPKYFVNG